jgi:hypothetical protein
MRNTTASVCTAGWRCFRTVFRHFPISGAVERKRMSSAPVRLASGLAGVFLCPSRKIKSVDFFCSVGYPLIMPQVEFEWNAKKERENRQKHGISFKHAAKIFHGQVLQWENNRFDYGETRMIGIGQTEDRFLRVVFTRRGHKIRIISAKKAKNYEKRKYRQRFGELHI